MLKLCKLRNFWIPFAVNFNIPRIPAKGDVVMNRLTVKLALIMAILLLINTGIRTASSEPGAEAAAPLLPSGRAVPVTTPGGTSYSSSTGGEPAIVADADSVSYSNITVTKSGNMENEHAGDAGDNAGVLAKNGAALTLCEISVVTDGILSNALFSCGSETSIDIADSTVKTIGDNSAALVSSCGCLNANNLVVYTSGTFSPALLSSPGCGSIAVSGGSYVTSGEHSPSVCSASDIRVSDAELSAAASAVAVLVDSGSVTFENVSAISNSANKDVHSSAGVQAVLIQQDPDGDSYEEAATFTMLGGSITNMNGEVFCVRHANAVINLTGSEIINDDPSEILLHIDPSGSDLSEKSGSHAQVNTAAQFLSGDILVGGFSSLKLSLLDGSIFTGAVRSSDSGDVSVTLTDGSVWVLTGDSRITSLTCEPGSIQLNGFTLTVNGSPYTESSASECE